MECIVKLLLHNWNSVLGQDVSLVTDDDILWLLLNLLVLWRFLFISEAWAHGIRQLCIVKVLIILLVGSGDLTKSIQSLVSCLLFLVFTRFKVIFLNVWEDLLELDIGVILVLLAVLELFHLVFEDVLHSSLNATLEKLSDLLILSWYHHIVVHIFLLSLAQLGNLSFKTVNGQSLCSRDLKDSLNMYNNLIKIRIILFDLFKCLLLINFKHLFLYSDSGSFVFFCFLLEVGVDHIFQTWLLLLYSNLIQSSYNDILQHIFKVNSLLVNITVNILFLQMSG